MRKTRKHELVNEFIRDCPSMVTQQLEEKGKFIYWSPKISREMGDSDLLTRGVWRAQI